MAIKKVSTKMVTKKVKKPTKKTPAKKSVKKSDKKTTSASKNKKGKVLICAKDKQCFWTNDGKIIQDLTELRDALKEMSQEVFAHHVTKEKNDFADWVEHVLNDTPCADDLRKSKKPNTSRLVVVRHLRYYNI